LVTRRAFLGAIADNARASGPNEEREGHWWSWASGFGQVADVSGSSGNSSYDFSTGGIVTGASFGLTDRAALGFVVGASTSDINVALQPGNNRHRSVDGALYGAYIDGPISATATASFGYDRFLTDRSINTGFSAVQASGRIGGYTTAGRLEGAYALDMGAFTLSPYVAAQVMNFHHGTYDETGAGTIGLRIAAENVTSIRSTLGLAAEKELDLGKFGSVTLHLGAAWEREFGDRILSSKAAFLAAPSQSFEITGITQDKDTANVVGGLTAALTGNVNVSLRYEGNLGATETVNRGRADLTWRW
jgi:outer membrane autotransporter protein